MFFRKLKRNISKIDAYLRDLTQDFGIFNQFISEIIAKDSTEYQQDKARLFGNNLDDASKKILTTVLNRYEFLTRAGVYSGGCQYMLGTIKDCYFTTTEELNYKNTELAQFHRDIIDNKNGTWSYKEFIIPSHSIWSSVFLDEQGLYKVSTPIPATTAIIDVGGFIGDSVLIFRKHFSNPIYSFEPTQANYQLALKTMELNKVSNAVMENLALGDTDGEIQMNFDGAGSTISNTGSETVQMTTLDNYTRSHNITVGMIKVDIEGAEQVFLRGAMETIKRDRPIMLLSIYHNYDDFFHIKPLIESWNLDYKFQIHKPLGTLFSEIILICEPSSR